ncbi:hypothetical protein V8G54_004039 [Vigna mungo]|uniref:Uncharacterized protein n=1 Tax=Vigna mungo TaxID=3915 RepID=A0AAQ3PDG0_VIGMU
MEELDLDGRAFLKGAVFALEAPHATLSRQKRICGAPPEVQRNRMALLEFQLKRQTLNQKESIKRTPKKLKTSERERRRTKPHPNWVRRLRTGGKSMGSRRNL